VIELVFYNVSLDVRPDDSNYDREENYIRYKITIEMKTQFVLCMGGYLMTGLHIAHSQIRGNKEIKPEGQQPMTEDTWNSMT